MREAILTDSLFSKIESQFERKLFYIKRRNLTHVYNITEFKKSVAFVVLAGKANESRSKLKSKLTQNKRTEEENKQNISRLTIIENM